MLGQGHDNGESGGATTRESLRAVRCPSFSHAGTNRRVPGGASCRFLAAGSCTSPATTSLLLCLLFTTNTWWSAHCVAILDASLPTWSRGSTPHKTTAIIGQESCNIHWQKFCSFHFRRLLRVAKIKGVITIIHLTVSIHVYRCLYIQIFRLLFFSKYKTHRGAMCRCFLLQ